jgi:hypothetical protein
LSRSGCGGSLECTYICGEKFIRNYSSGSEIKKNADSSVYVMGVGSESTFFLLHSTDIHAISAGDIKRD